jgi:hypothetical protein
MKILNKIQHLQSSATLPNIVVLCAGGPEFWPVLPEPEVVQLRLKSSSTNLCCKLLSDIGETT